MRRLTKTSLLLIDTALVSLASIGAVLCLVTAFSMTLRPEYLTGAVIMTLIFCLLARLPRGGLASLITLGVLLMLAFINRRTLIDSFLILWRLLRQEYALGYTFFQEIPEGRPVTWPGSGPALLTLMLALCFVLSVIVSRKKSPILSCLLLAVAVYPCYILTDTPPSAFAVCAVVGPALVWTMTARMRRREDDERLTACLWAAPAAAALLIAVVLLVPQKTYKPPVAWDALTARLSVLDESLGQRGTSSYRPRVNTPDSIRLSELTEQNMSEGIVMTVTGDREETFYLRGTAYDRFDGESWELSDGGGYDVRNVFPRLGETADGLLSIRTFRRADVIYLPVGVTALRETWKPVSDSHVPNANAQLSYSVAWAYQSTDDLVSADGAVEVNGRLLFGEEYADTVETCLELPEETLAAVRSWIRTAFPDRVTEVYGTPSVTVITQTMQSTEELANAVAEAISSHGVYTLEPETCPEGKDFVTWFLTEAEGGYCVHYATAGAAVLRAMGIPARVVAGYVTRTAPGRAVPVRGKQAHAWVEYYEPNGGWHTLEVSPPDAPALQALTEPLEEMTEYAPAELPLEIHEQPPEEEPPEEEPEQTPEPEEETRPTESPSDETVPLNWLYALLVLPLAAVVLVLRRVIAGWIFRRRLARMDTNGQVTALYGRCKELWRVAAAEPEQEAKTAAERAYFSNHPSPPEDVTLLQQTLERAVRQAEKVPLRRRLCARYILAVL